ncbi:MAG: FMN-binding negative transcriptional regulator, partial [Chloroflexota bacterium]
TPWKMGDAPQEYLTGMLSSIVGIEIPVRTMTGKWKLGQNRVEADRLGAIAGLRETDQPQAEVIANAMEQALLDRG